jgi:hypothetical protein
MSISEGPGQHPITAALTLMEQALTGAADAAAWSLPDEDVLEALHHGERLAARLAGLQLRLIGEAGARDVASRLGRRRRRRCCGSGCGCTRAMPSVR